MFFTTASMAFTGGDGIYKRMNITEGMPLSSVGHTLDTSEETFGELRESSYLLGDGESLRTRMEEDGYLYLRGFFRRPNVMAARKVIVDRLAALGYLAPGSDPMEALKGEKDLSFLPELALNNPALDRLLYSGRMLDFYREFFGEAVKHFDFTWLRVMTPGQGTVPHCDMVYMGRGTREKLLTAWVPLGDAPLNVGGLMILENSHLKHEMLRPYLERDVDTYCKNGRHAADIESGKKGWEWNGSLSKNPVSLQQKLGGRWLTTDYEAGDLLTFSMYCVHGSVDNKSDRIRISSDSRYQPASLPVDERWIGEKPIGHALAGKRGRVC